MTVIDTTGNRKDHVASLLGMTLIVSLAAYTITYDAVPALRTPFAFLLAILCLGLLYISFLVSSKRALPLLLVVVMLALISVLLQIFYGPQNFVALLRYETSITALLVFMVAPIPDIRRAASRASVIIIIFAVISAALNGQYSYAGTERFHPFWADVANSSLLMSAAIVIIAVSGMGKNSKRFWSAVGLILLVGYGAVTAMLMVTIFLLGWLFLHRGWSRIWLFVVSAIAVGAGVLYRSANSVAGSDINSLGVGAVGSGRFDSWLVRWREFQGRAISEKLIGHGPYSDYQTTTLWWWDAKNAHSDVVTLTMEFGLIGVLVVLFASIWYYKRFNKLSQLALLAAAFGGVASNSILDRPGVAIAWGIAIYCASLNAGSHLANTSSGAPIELERSLSIPARVTVR